MKLSPGMIDILAELSRQSVPRSCPRSPLWNGQSLLALERRGLVDCISIERVIRRYHMRRESEVKRPHMEWRYEITAQGKAVLAAARQPPAPVVFFHAAPPGRLIP